MTLFGGRVRMGVFMNEFYFLPSISVLTDTWTLYFRFLTWYMTIQLKEPSENQSNGLSEEAQKKLDEFFEILEQENQKE
jgi:hypothetical protein